MTEKPIPTPDPGESENNFMSRCISFVEGEGMDHDQAIAICSTEWDNKNFNNMLIDVTKYKTQKELFDFLSENKKSLIAQKKAEMKKADGIAFCNTFFCPAEKAYKANEPVDLNVDSLKVMAIINTTNFLDSHNDVHLSGIWDKSLRENKMIMHIQEHIMKFDHVISDGKDLTSYVKEFTWKELGFDYEGTTQALVFESKVLKSRNPYMFEQYGKGYVKNHSVGMHYVKILLAINNEDYGAEFEAWEKYYPIIANKETADERGHFWVVKEAKVIEGSAVVKGSNIITPTVDNNMKFEPMKVTQEPGKLTPKTGYDFDYLLKKL